MRREMAERAQRRPNYYARVSDPEALVEAAQVEGIDDELDELRVRLRELIGDDRANFEMILKGMAMVARMAAARYRMSAKSKEELASAIAEVVRGVGVQLLPEEDGDV